MVIISSRRRFSGRELRLAAAVLSLVMTAPAVALGQAFVPSEAPVGGVLWDPGRPDVVDIGGVTYPMPADLRPQGDVQVELRLSPAGDVLYGRKFSTNTARPVCNPGAGFPFATRVYFYRLVSGPSAELQAIAVSDCIGAPISAVGFVGAPTGAPYTAYVAEAETGPSIRIIWFDLLGTNGIAVTNHNSTLGDLRFSPDFTAAMIQNDVDESIGVDYDFVDLCPNRLGQSIGPVPGLQNFSNSDLYSVSLDVAAASRSVDVTIGMSNYNFALTPCYTAIGLSVGVDVVPVSRSGTQVDLIYRYDVLPTFESARLIGSIPPNLTVVTDPIGIDANRFFATQVTGAGEVSIRVDAADVYGDICIGINVPRGTYRLEATWNTVDTNGNPVQVMATQGGPRRCVKSGVLEVAKLGPTEVYERQPATYVLEYSNVGQLVSRNVFIEDIVAMYPDRYLWESEPGGNFTITSDNYARFDLGSVAAGATGTAEYTIRSRCLNSPTENVISGSYGINGEPERRSNVFNGFPDVQTTILPLSGAPMTARLLVDRDPATVPVGATVVHTLELTNQATEHPHQVFASFVVAPCFEVDRVLEGADSLLGQGPNNIRFEDDVPAAATTRVVLQNRVLSGCSGNFALNHDVDITINYGCGEQLHLSPVPTVAAGAPDAGVAVDSGVRDGGDPSTGGPGNNAGGPKDPNENKDDGGCVCTNGTSPSLGLAAALAFAVLVLLPGRRRR